MYISKKILNMISLPTSIFYTMSIITTYVVLYSSLQNYSKYFFTEKGIDISQWMEEHDFKIVQNLFYNRDYQLTYIDKILQLNGIEEERIHRILVILKEKLILAQWLKSLDLYNHVFKFISEDINSLEDVYNPNENDIIVHQILGEDYSKWIHGKTKLPNTKETLELFKADLWNLFISSEKYVDNIRRACFSGCIIVISTLFVLISVLIFKCRVWSAMQSDVSLLHILTGRYLDSTCCVATFLWNDPTPVGETLKFTVEFFQRNGLPYPVCDKDNLQIEINHGVRKISSVITLGGAAPNDANLCVVEFTVRFAGNYKIHIMINNRHIIGSPFEKKFLPGPVSASKTKFERHSSIMIFCVDITNRLMIQPRDSFQNNCLMSSVLDENLNLVNLTSFKSVISEFGKKTMDVCKSFKCDKIAAKIILEIVFMNEGSYEVQVFYEDELIQNGTITCIVLNRFDYDQIMKGDKTRTISYEAKLVRVDGEPPFKPKRVFIDISPKQFIVKEYIFKFLLKRVATFRICPNTKITLLEEVANGLPLCSVDDGFQPTIHLSSPERNLIVGTFTKFLLNGIGGSDTFLRKQIFFYNEVKSYHREQRHKTISLRIEREDILLSSLKATKYFTLKEWCSNFEVTFQGEIGIDHGGLRREWFQLISDALFNANNQLFTSLTKDSQALVYPNNNRPNHLKLRYYEFAGKIVGKCLYESALGGPYSQYIRVKFMRSFLAQLIGLRINHNYFESDDPDLFISKVKYVLENDISNMELYFVDEHYDQNGQLKKVIDLIPNGNKIKVTNRSKLQYLDKLAQYRLATSVKEEVETFLKGLNEIIPDNLLNIFDENELELLICGTGEYSIADFRAYHKVSGHQLISVNFNRVLEWFWMAVSNFTIEEMARLLQFTTGSSQLPPGGFKDLNPRFTIMPSYTVGLLPTAHTCFNQLCLPDYESYEILEKSLLLAINEGSEGFGLS